MLSRDAWDSVFETLQTVLKLLKPVTQAALVNSGLNAASGHWWHVATATAIAPETLSLKRMRVRDPYTSDKRLRESLQILSAHGFLRPVGAGQFLATEKAQAAIQIVSQHQRDAFTAMQFVSDEILAPVVDDLLQVLDQALNVTEIATPALKDALKRPIEASQPLMEQFARAVSYLNAYRIDCHNASWKAYHINGLMWEILTQLWLDAPLTLEMLQDTLKFRDYRKRDFNEALKKLVKLGWITEHEGGFALSVQGRAVRDDAETVTDHYFLQAWASLPQERIEQLLIRVQDIDRRAQATL